MRVWQVVLGTLVIGTAAPIALHVERHGAYNLHQMGLAFFLWLNTLVTMWEWCLGLRIGHIETLYADFKARYRGRELDRVKDFFMTPMPPSKLLSATAWSELWATYAVFDESYADRRSFGFFIDVGNGLSTFVPSLLFLYGMTFELLPARALGLLGALLFYQTWYGTLVYFGSYLFNRRYVGHTPSNVALFVGLSNGLWFTLPVWGFYASVVLIYTDSYALFGW
jgi:hypothetical protein